MQKRIRLAFWIPYQDILRYYAKHNAKLLFFTGIVISIIFITGCSTEPDIEEHSFEFLTTQTNYLTSDTITVTIINDSTDVFDFGLRCGGYLEMFYQKEENGEWSDNQWLWYMSLLCPTIIDSVKSGESFSYEMPAEWFKGTGTFRLILGEYYSNRFILE